MPGYPLTTPDMEGRKRPYEGETPVSIKKRALTSSHDSPVTAVSPGAAAEEPQPNEELEEFRKEAIYRRMLHYSRQAERSHQRIEELKARTLSYEASLTAIETCWDQLLQQIQLLVKSDQIPTDLEEPGFLQLTQQSANDEIFSKAFNDALRGREARTIQLLKNILALPPRSTAPDALDLQRTCQRLLSEVNGTKGELKLTRARLEEASSLAERYLEQLAVAENKVERLKSETVQRVESKIRQFVTVKKEETTEPNGTHVKVEQVEAPVPTINGLPQPQEEKWQAKAVERGRLIEQLRNEIMDLTHQLTQARVEAAAPSIPNLRSLTLYKQLEVAVEKHKKAEETAREEAAALRDYVGQLNAERAEYQARIQAEANVKVTDLKTMLEKRESDLTRLREGRDALIAELHERKAKEAEREGSLSQSKILASARGERVAMLVSENHRLKARLAAREGEESFFAFIMSNPQDESYVRAQEERVDILQRNKDSLEATLKTISSTNPDAAAAIKSEAEARAKCSELQQRLDKFESTYGTEALALTSPEIQALSEQLHRKEEEVRCLRLELKASLEEPTALYTEIERLSGLWENLDKQLKGKIFDLTAMEEKLSKSATEKAKADNKYFATMREQDALKAVKAAQTREISKQSKIIERLVDAEKSLNAQLSHLEKENQLQAKAISERDAMITAAQVQTDRERALLDLGNKRVTELQEQLKERDAQLAKRQTELQKKSEECIDLQYAAEEKIAKHRTANATGDVAEVMKEREKLMAILRCSTCKINLRDHTLVKCMHTFCKNCIDARLTTRQRKCPACGLPFGNSDVQQLFFQ